MVLTPQLQNSGRQCTYNHCLYTVQTTLNFAAWSFCCKITLIWLGSFLSVVGYALKHIRLAFTSSNITFLHHVNCMLDSLPSNIGLSLSTEMLMPQYITGIVRNLTMIWTSSIILAKCVYSNELNSPKWFSLATRLIRGVRSGCVDLGRWDINHLSGKKAMQA